MAKFTLVAYFLWLVVGWLGLHHFYLERDRQGILWLTSFAGMFGIGWIRDFWRIPTYVKDANEDPDYMEFLGAEMRYYNHPPIWKNLYRIVGQVMFGVFYRAVVYGAIPEELSHPYLVFLVIPIGAAFGTYMVSNSGRIKSHFGYSLVGAYVGEILFGVTPLMAGYRAPTFAVGVSMLFSTFGWKYRRAREKSPCCNRVATWVLISLLFFGMLTSFTYFNATVETDSGETIKVREAVNNFFKSPAWRDVKESFWTVYEEYQEEGWEGAQRRFRTLADVEGEDSALMVLGLEKGASMKEVKAKYHELARDSHPDHYHGEAKTNAQERIIEINKAYETITAIYKRRGRT